MKKFLPVFLIAFFFFALIFSTRQNKSNKQYIREAYTWFQNDVNPQINMLEYQYFPKENRYSKDNNGIRQLMTIWTITNLEKFLGSHKMQATVNKTVDYYKSYIQDNKEISLSYQAMMILVLLNIDYPNKENLLKEYAETILSLQDSSGAYFMDPSRTNIEYTNKGIASGEIMLSLVKLYEANHDPRYLQSVEKSFPFYRKFWLDDKYFFIHWQTQAYYLLFEEIKNPTVADFIFQMNDWILDNYQNEKTGGIPKENSNINTATIMEGVIEAYQLADELNDTKHMEKYKKAIKLALPFIYSLQIDENETRKLIKPDKAFGGFIFSKNDPSQMIDNTAHASNALIKAETIGN